MNQKIKQAKVHLDQTITTGNTKGTIHAELDEEAGLKVSGRRRKKKKKKIDSSDNSK